MPGDQIYAWVEDTTPKWAEPLVADGWSHVRLIDGDKKRHEWTNWIKEYRYPNDGAVMCFNLTLLDDDFDADGEDWRLETVFALDIQDYSCDSQGGVMDISMDGVLAMVGAFAHHSIARPMSPDESRKYWMETNDRSTIDVERTP